MPSLLFCKGLPWLADRYAKDVEPPALHRRKGVSPVPSPFSPEKTERAAAAAPVVGSGEPIRPCPVCGAPLRGRQTSAGSDRCRAAKSRRKRVPLPVAEARAIRADLTRALEAVWGAKATLEKYGGG